MFLDAAAAVALVADEHRVAAQLGIIVEYQRRRFALERADVAPLPEDKQPFEAQPIGEVRFRVTRKEACDRGVEGGMLVGVAAVARSDGAQLRLQLPELDVDEKRMTGQERYDLRQAGRIVCARRVAGGREQLIGRLFAELVRHRAAHDTRTRGGIVRTTAGYKQQKSGQPNRGIDANTVT
ncbi:MAG TPA: hypothetical protein VFR86_11600 [Burkholderiaceae bacterium]|nr:hypothetical protein [Burkholderiaceae bacterium]